MSAGPTVSRRSARSLDFRPSRPALNRRAIGTHGRRKEPPDAKVLESVRTPAKGLPALEWLLWDPDAPQTPATCRFASGLALEVGFSAQPAVTPAVISLEALLRGRGLNREADQWAQVVMTADEAMQVLTQEEDRPPTAPLDTALAPQLPRAALPSTAVMQAAVAAAGSSPGDVA